MNSGTTSVLLVACSWICMCALPAAGVDPRSSVQLDLTLIANSASPEEQLSAEQNDLRERLAVINTRIQAEENGERRGELRGVREILLAREKAVTHRLDQTRLSLARVKLRILKADHSALLASLALLDARLSAEEDESRLSELRTARESVISREATVRRAIEQAESSIRLQRPPSEIPATNP